MRANSNPIALPHIPDDITLAEFMLAHRHPLRASRGRTACLIDARTKRQVSLEEVGPIAYSSITPTHVTQQLRENTSAVASIFQNKLSIGKGDVVMIFSPNHIDFPVAAWAVLSIGGIVSCSNPTFSPSELGYQLKASKSTCLIAHSINVAAAISAARSAGISPDRLFMMDKACSSAGMNFPCISDLVQAGRRERAPFNPRKFSKGEGKVTTAFLSWSSGTTGRPKAVCISHYGFIANVLQMAAHNQVETASPSRIARGYRSGDVATGVLPWFHVAGLVINLHFVLFSGMSVVVFERYKLLDMLEAVACHRISHLVLVPPQAIDLCKHPAVTGHDLTGIKYIMIGAAPVPREVQSQLCDLFPHAQIGQAYGLTEMTTVLSMIAARQPRGPIGSGGQLLPGVEARVIRADGSLASSGEPGELVVRGPAAALGYLNDEKATRETFVNGWVHTGDQVILGDDKEIYVIDRLKACLPCFYSIPFNLTPIIVIQELIKVKGFQVAPAELEGCLLDHQEVADCCVVGMPDIYSGELPLAYVVLTSDARRKVQRRAEAAYDIKSSIMKHVAEQKASYKHLKGGIFFIDEIPKNGSGKLLRRVLREQAKEIAKQRPRL